MAADQTHDPTQKRIEKARSDGRFPNSPYILASFGLLASIACLDWFARGIAIECVLIYRQIVGGNLLDSDPDVHSFAWRVLWCLLPGFLIIWMITFLVGFAQTGGYWNPTKAIALQLPNFSWSFADKLVRLGILLATLVLSIYGLVISSGYACITFSQNSLQQSIEIMFRQITFSGYWLAVTLVLWSLCDYGYLRWTFHQGLKMSHQELKDELQDQERVQIARPISVTGDALEK